ncbi:hypothetical protein CBR_g47048 [Chara braunii]|uniref:Retrotransposon gag domain-containing protein n=1 Tax=Chara braunii TaxID=69332 RepID=A0A388M1A5_CHABU|nr:hypothetical protein CBR_g47048 [Chara braunii]|eukprot:GBG88350.1 hypothetical protein CBR_g47048 [Chara braunii]
MKASIHSVAASIRMWLGSTSVTVTLGTLEATDLCTPGTLFPRIVGPKVLSAPASSHKLVKRVTTIRRKSLLRSMSSESFETIRSVPADQPHTDLGFSEVFDDTAPLLRLECELSPGDSDVDMAITITMQPLEIVYSPVFFKQAAAFFRKPTSLPTHQDMIISALNGLGTLHAQTLHKAEYVSATRKRMLLRADIQTLLVVIPENITASDGMLLIVDLGLLHVGTAIEQNSKKQLVEDAVHNMELGESEGAGKGSNSQMGAGVFGLQSSAESRGKEQFINESHAPESLYEALSSWTPPADVLHLMPFLASPCKHRGLALCSSRPATLPMVTWEKDEDLDTWVRTAPAYARHKFTRPEQKVIVVASFLEGSAARWLNGLVQQQGYGQNFDAWAQAQTLEDFVRSVYNRWHDPQGAQKATDAINNLCARRYKIVHEIIDTVERLLVVPGVRYDQQVLLTDYLRCLPSEVRTKLVDEAYVDQHNFASFSKKALDIEAKLGSPHQCPTDGRRKKLPQDWKKKSQLMFVDHDGQTTEIDEFPDLGDKTELDGASETSDGGVVSPIKEKARGTGKKKVGRSMGRGDQRNTRMGKTWFGKRHIFVMVDRFSKYARLIAMPEIAKIDYIIRLFMDNWECSATDDSNSFAFSLDDCESGSGVKSTEARTRDNLGELHGLASAALYNHYTVRMTDSQILVACHSSNWRTCLKNRLLDPYVHLVERFDLHLQIASCALQSDPTLTRLKVTGHLPVLHFYLSVAKFQAIRAILKKLASADRGARQRSPQYSPQAGITDSESQGISGAEERAHDGRKQRSSQTYAELFEALHAGWDKKRKGLEMQPSLALTGKGSSGGVRVGGGEGSASREPRVEMSDSEDIVKRAPLVDLSLKVGVTELEIGLDGMPSDIASGVQERVVNSKFVFRIKDGWLWYILHVKHEDLRATIGIMEVMESGQMDDIGQGFSVAMGCIPNLVSGARSAAVSTEQASQLSPSGTFPLTRRCSPQENVYATVSREQEHVMSNMAAGVEIGSNIQNRTTDVLCLHYHAQHSSHNRMSGNISLQASLCGLELNLNQSVVVFALAFSLSVQVLISGGRLSDSGNERASGDVIGSESDKGDAGEGSKISSAGVKGMTGAENEEGSLSSGASINELLVGEDNLPGNEICASALSSPGDLMPPVQNLPRANVSLYQQCKTNVVIQASAKDAAEIEDGACLETPVSDGNANGLGGLITQRAKLRKCGDNGITGSPGTSSVANEDVCGKGERPGCSYSVHIQVDVSKLAVNLKDKEGKMLCLRLDKGISKASGFSNMGETQLRADGVVHCLQLVRYVGSSPEDCIGANSEKSKPVIRWQASKTIRRSTAHRAGEEEKPATLEINLENLRFVVHSRLIRRVMQFCETVSAGILRTGYRKQSSGSSSQGLQEEPRISNGSCIRFNLLNSCLVCPTDVQSKEQSYLEASVRELGISYRRKTRSDEWESSGPRSESLKRESRSWRNFQHRNHPGMQLPIEGITKACGGVWSILGINCAGLWFTMRESSKGDEEAWSTGGSRSRGRRDDILGEIAVVEAFTVHVAHLRRAMVPMNQSGVSATGLRERLVLADASTRRIGLLIEEKGVRVLTSVWENNLARLGSDSSACQLESSCEEWRMAADPCPSSDMNRAASGCYATSSIEMAVDVGAMDIVLGKRTNGGSNQVSSVAAFEVHSITADVWHNDRQGPGLALRWKSADLLDFISPCAHYDNTVHSSEYSSEQAQGSPARTGNAWSDTPQSMAGLEGGSQSLDSRDSAADEDPGCYTPDDRKLEEQSDEEENIAIMMFHCGASDSQSFDKEDWPGIRLDGGSLENGFVSLSAKIPGTVVIMRMKAWVHLLNVLVSTFSRGGKEQTDTVSRDVELGLTSFEETNSPHSLRKAESHGSFMGHFLPWASSSASLSEAQSQGKTELPEDGEEVDGEMESRGGETEREIPSRSTGVGNCGIWPGKGIILQVMANAVEFRIPDIRNTRLKSNGLRRGKSENLMKSRGAEVDGYASDLESDDNEYLDDEMEDQHDIGRWWWNRQYGWEKSGGEAEGQWPAEDVFSEKPWDTMKQKREIVLVVNAEVLFKLKAECESTVSVNLSRLEIVTEQQQVMDDSWGVPRKSPHNTSRMVLARAGEIRANGKLEAISKRLLRENMEMVDIHGGLQVEIFDFSVFCSYQTLKAFREFRFEDISTDSKLVVACRGQLAVDAGHILLLVSDGQWQNDAPILELFNEGLKLQLLVNDKEIRASLKTKFGGDYHNIDKIAWEPFLEHWVVQGEFIQLWERDGIALSPPTMAISIRSSHELNINVTESFVETKEELAAMNKTLQKVEAHPYEFEGVWNTFLQRSVAEVDHHLQAYIVKLDEQISKTLTPAVIEKLVSSGGGEGDGDGDRKKKGLLQEDAREGRKMKVKVSWTNTDKKEESVLHWIDAVESYVYGQRIPYWDKVFMASSCMAGDATSFAISLQKEANCQSMVEYSQYTLIEDFFNAVRERFEDKNLARRTEMLILNMADRKWKSVSTLKSTMDELLQCVEHGLTTTQILNNVARALPDRLRTRLYPRTKEEGMTYEKFSKIALDHAGFLAEANYCHYWKDLQAGKKWQNRTISGSIPRKDNLLLTFEEGGVETLFYDQIDYGLEGDAHNGSVVQEGDYAAVAARGEGRQGRGHGRGRGGRGRGGRGPDTRGVVAKEATTWEEGAMVPRKVSEDPTPHGEEEEACGMGTGIVRIHPILACQKANLGKS